MFKFNSTLYTVSISIVSFLAGAVVTSYLKEIKKHR